MSRHSYTKVSSRSSGGSYRGFRLRYSRRFSVQALHARFMFIFRILKKWTYTYYRALKFLKKRLHAHDGGGDGHHRRIGKMSEMGSSRSMDGLLVADFMPKTRNHECRMRSLGRSNSFYSEAIADCLEFIKRNSASDEDEKTMSPNDEGSIENNNLNSNTLCKEKLEMVS